MSPLTKLFVVLLVLVSVALSAGTITFVNKLDPLQKQLTAAKAQASSSQTLLDKANAAAATSQQQIENERRDAAGALAAANASLLKARADLADRDAQIAKLNNNLAVMTSANNSQSTALSASEGAKTLLQEQVSTLRTDADKRLRENTDLNQHVSSLTAELTRTEAERRNLAEQLVAANTKTEQMGALIKDLGGTSAQLDTAGSTAGAPAVNGVIRSRRTIAGKDYATISIGSADFVRKGMQFKILDANTGSFLGLMTVEVVDRNEAIGQITAEPQNLAQIKAGNVVRTQI